MLGTEFINNFSRRPLATWEAAALELGRQNLLTPWPYVDVTVVDGADTAVFGIASDVLSVGSFEDHLRLPLTPGVAQSIANLSGALLTTPWLEYVLWRAAPMKLSPTAMVPNQGANLEQYAAHSRIIDDELRSRGVTPGTLIGGIKKGVVVANFYKAGKVLLFGWYRPEPDVFDDGKQMGAIGRQPVQPKSNVHGDFYVDYSHGIRLVRPTCIVNGQRMETAALYQHPTLYKLANPDSVNPPGQRGPIRVPRYPASVAPAAVRMARGPSIMGPAAETVVPRQGRVPFTPDPTEIALDAIARRKLGHG